MNVEDIVLFSVYTVSQKNDNDVPRYNNAHQPILIIFGRDIAK